MTTKKTVTEFTYKQNSNFGPGLVRRTLYGTWPDFLNTYGVWPNYGNGVETHTLNFAWTPVKGGVYTFKATCDNAFTWSLANAWVQGPPENVGYYSGSGFNGSIARGTPASSGGGTFRRKYIWPGFVTGFNQQNQIAFTQVLKGSSWQTIESVVPKTMLPGLSNQSRGIALTGSTADFVANNFNKGPVRMRFQVTNLGGPAAFAATITNSDGVVEWSTIQDYENDATGRYYDPSFPFDASLTVHAWGGGGGGGGQESTAKDGGYGSHGLYNTKTFSISKGQALEIFVGKGGGGGQGPAGGGKNQAGGIAGESRTSIAGNVSQSFNGGKGGQSGSIGHGGGGGGGGGASGVILDGEIVLVAAGGGGGGGAGDAVDSTPITSTITYNASGTTATDYRGENGENKGVNNGGGGGGGGGGYPGGQGGNTVPGDRTGLAGQTGGNFPTFSATDGKNTDFYRPGFAEGGLSARRSGQDGRVVIEVSPLSLIGVKDSGTWKQVANAYAKVSGTWKDINTVYIKVDGEWRKIEGSGQDQSDYTLASNTTSYGTSIRTWA